MRFLQDFYFKTGNKTKTVEISLDIVNAGNLISSKWGVRKYATFVIATIYEGAGWSFSVHRKLPHWPMDRN